MNEASQLVISRAGIHSLVSELHRDADTVFKSNAFASSHFNTSEIGVVISINSIDGTSRVYFGSIFVPDGA